MTGSPAAGATAGIHFDRFAYCVEYATSMPALRARASRAAIFGTMPCAHFTGWVLQIGSTTSETNNAVVALFSDAGGLPGTKIASVEVNNLPTFGTCCSLVTVGSAGDKGIKLTAGTQYWLVAATDTASETAFDVWDYTWNDSTGPIAFEGTATGNVWTSGCGVPGSCAHAPYRRRRRSKEKVHGPNPALIFSPNG